MPRREINPAVLKLLDWFSRTREVYPWRIRRTPYRVWVSEVMLQQTVVAAVVPYFRRWMKRFPDLRALASASEPEVLRMWEGLGYYSRARNLSRAARLIVLRFGGDIPAEEAALRSLPGIGEYTAAAILSLAFGRPMTLIDANIRRIVSRLKGWRKWNRKRGREASVFLSGLMPPERPAEFNEALMELGQKKCLPRETRCGECPLAGICRSRHVVRRRSVPEKRQAVMTKESTVVVFVKKDRILLRRETGELFRGLWTFPRFPGKNLPEGRFRVVKRLEPVIHCYTRNRETLYPFLAVPLSNREEGVLVKRGSVERLAMPSAYRRILRLALQAVAEREK